MSRQIESREFLRRLVLLIPKSVREAVYNLPYGYTLKKWFERLLTCKTYRWYQFQKGPRGGMKMKLKLPEENEFFLETHDPYITEFLWSYIQPGSIVAEIGAHIGYYTIIISKKVGINGKVFALEPFPTNAQRLKEHLWVNQCEGNCTVIEVAAGNKDCDDSEFLQFSATTMGRLATRDMQDGELNAIRSKVKCRKLDSLADEEMIPFPDFVKIDVEGTEADVLTGMAIILEKSRPTLLIEVHSDRSAEDTSRFLKKFGYTAYGIKGGQPIPLRMSSLIGLNILFTPSGEIKKFDSASQDV